MPRREATIAPGADSGDLPDAEGLLGASTGHSTGLSDSIGAILYGG